VISLLTESGIYTLVKRDSHGQPGRVIADAYGPRVVQFGLRYRF